MTQTASAAGQIIQRLDVIDSRMTMIESALKALTAPHPRTAKPPLQMIAEAMQQLSQASRHQREAIEDLHKRMQEPGIMRAIERALKD